MPPNCSQLVVLFGNAVERLGREPLLERVGHWEQAWRCDRLTSSLLSASWLQTRCDWAIFSYSRVMLSPSCWTVSPKLWTKVTPLPLSHQGFDNSSESNEYRPLLRHRCYSVKHCEQSWHVVWLNWVATVWSSVNPDIDSLVRKSRCLPVTVSSPYTSISQCLANSMSQTAEVNLELQIPNWNSPY